MRRDSIVGFGAVLGLALLVGHGVASAQAQNAPQQPPDAGAGLSRQVNLSPAEQLAQADGSLSRMEGSRSTVRRQLESARAQRDVVKTLCLNDKLNQLDVTLRSSRERKTALEAAVARKDTDLAGHEFTILGVFKQRGDRLFAEANQCVGTDIGTIGDTRVTPTVDPGIPDDYQGPPPTPLTPVIVPPPVAATPAT